MHNITWRGFDGHVSGQRRNGLQRLVQGPLPASWGSWYSWRSRSSSWGSQTGGGVRVHGSDYLHQVLGQRYQQRGVCALNVVD